jgi:hypothetical protein
VEAPHTLANVSSFVRPAIAEQTYRDADGAVIAYGSRWGIAGPAEDSYSVVSHAERFAPLHQIAHALIDHLQRRYLVEVTDDLRCAQDLRLRRVEAERAVRLTPTATDAATLTFVFTDFPGVIVHAGLLHDFSFPICGCDACDETWQSMADRLEFTVQAVISGGYREEVRGGDDDPWIWHQLSTDDQRHGGGGDATADAGAHLRATAERLRVLRGAWAPWPRR